MRVGRFVTCVVGRVYAFWLIRLVWGFGYEMDWVEELMYVVCGVCLIRVIDMCEWS